MPDDDIAPTARGQNDWRPVPDPTKLTSDLVNVATAQIRREIGELDARIREYLTGRAALSDTKIADLEKLVDAKLTALEKAASVFEDGLNRIPTTLQVEILHLRELHEAKFVAVSDALAAHSSSMVKQLDERDVRYALVSSDAQKAVADALAAQKEAVYKQDASTQKAIDALVVLLNSTASGQATQLADLKERMTRSEVANATALLAQSTKTTSVSQLISWGLLAVAAIALVLPILERLAQVAGK